MNATGNETCLVCATTVCACLLENSGLLVYSLIFTTRRTGKVHLVHHFRGTLADRKSVRVKREIWPQPKLTTQQRTLCLMQTDCRMDDRLVSNVLQATLCPDASAANDKQAVLKKSITIRDLCIDFLQSLRGIVTSTEVSQRLEQLVPRIERHITFQDKTAKRHFAQDFDAIGMKGTTN